MAILGKGKIVISDQIYLSWPLKHKRRGRGGGIGLVSIELSKLSHSNQRENRKRVSERASKHPACITLLKSDCVKCRRIEYNWRELIPTSISFHKTYWNYYIKKIFLFYYVSRLSMILQPQHFTQTGATGLGVARAKSPMCMLVEHDRGTFGVQILGSRSSLWESWGVSK